MAVFGPDDAPIGSGGWDVDVNGNLVPKGTTLNSVPKPTMTAPPGSPGGPQLSTPQGGPLITTPNSSTGAPAVQSPSATSFQPPATQTRPGLLTPNSRTGAPGYQVPTVNPMTLPGVGGLATGVGALNAIPTPTPKQMTDTLNNPPLANDPWLAHTLFPSIFGPAPNTQTAPAAPSPAPAPQTQPGSGILSQARGSVPPPPNINLPPFNVPPPPGNLPPFNRGPIPATPPSAARAPAARAPQNINLGYGAQGVAPPAAPSPMFTSIDRPNADIVGGPTRPGYLSADPHEPGGPARMGALDLSGLFNHPAVAAQAAAHPAVQGALAAQNAGQQQAPSAQTLQRKAPGFSNSRFFGNPANLQYPNMPF